MSRRLHGGWIDTVLAAGAGVGLALLVYGLPPGKPDFAAADTAVARFRPPSDFIAVGVVDGSAPCGDARCFHVARPTTALEPQLRAMLKSVGAGTITSDSCVTGHFADTETVVFCRLVGVLDGANVVLDLQPAKACPTRLTCTPTGGSSEVILSVSRAVVLAPYG